MVLSLANLAVMALLIDPLGAFSAMIATELILVLVSCSVQCG